jgi:enoyl-CoA hydratase/carnithine racemase
MKTLSLEFQDQLTIISLTHGVINSINIDMINELADVLKKIKDKTVRDALILTSSSEKFFSIGFDIPELIDYSREEFLSFYKEFNQVCLELYTFPRPTAAAIKGHAVAGGTILALCCDYRFIAAGHKLMGLNEIKLGVPVPYPADRILRQIVGDRIARDVIEGGEFYESSKLSEMGLVDGVYPLEQVLPKSIEKLSSLGEQSRDAYALIKESRVNPVAQQVSEHSVEKEEQFLDCWYSSAARDRLQAAMEKF